MWTKFGDDMSKRSWVTCMLDKTDRLTDRQSDRQTDKSTNEHTCQNCKFWQVINKPNLLLRKFPHMVITISSAFGRWVPPLYPGLLLRYSRILQIIPGSDSIWMFTIHKEIIMANFWSEMSLLKPYLVVKFMASLLVAKNGVKWGYIFYVSSTIANTVDNMYNFNIKDRRHCSIGIITITIAEELGFHVSCYCWAHFLLLPGTTDNLGNGIHFTSTGKPLQRHEINTLHVRSIIECSLHCKEHLYPCVGYMYVKNKRRFPSQCEVCLMYSTFHVQGPT